MPPQFNLTMDTKKLPLPTRAALYILDQLTSYLKADRELVFKSVTNSPAIMQNLACLNFDWFRAKRQYIYLMYNPITNQFDEVFDNSIKEKDLEHRIKPEQFRDFKSEFTTNLQIRVLKINFFIHFPKLTL